MNADHLLDHYERVADAPDAIPRLRRFILDLAVRGKLVPQDPNDESASDLLKRIAAEKARMVIAGEIRKPREAQDAAAVGTPFDIPTTWRWVRLDAIGAIVGGGTPPATDIENFADRGTGVPWLTPSDLGRQTPLFIARGTRDLSEKGLRMSAATVMPAGSVLFTSRAPIGYVSIAANPVATNQGFKSIVPYVADCSRFIALAMQAFAPGIDAKAPGTTFKEVSGKIVAALPFPLPPLNEQRRIVAKVDELMTLCDQLEVARKEREAARDRLAVASLSRLNAPDSDLDAFASSARFALGNLAAITSRTDQIKQLRQTILNLAVRGKLVPHDPNDESASELLTRIAMERVKVTSAEHLKTPANVALSPDGKAMPFPIPNGWSWTWFGQLIHHSEAGWSPKTENFERTGDNWGVLKVSAVSWDRFRPNENKQLLPNVRPKQAAEVHDGDFLISRANTSDLVAKCVLVDHEPLHLMMSDKIVRLRLTGLCDARFVLIVNNGASYARAYYAKNASGVSASMKNISRPVIFALPFPVPPLHEQRRIVAKVDELMALCERLEASIVAHDDHRRRLLGALLAEVLTPVDMQVV